MPMVPNYTVPDAEEQKIRETIAQQDEHLSPLDEEEIDRVQTVLKQLRHQRGEIDELQQLHKRSMSSLRRTPPEIWGEIFMQCLPAHEFIDMDVLRAPLLLTWVCSNWRSIALSMPRLWMSISVGGMDRSIRSSQSPLIKTWLQRSGNQRLSIQIYYDFDAQRSLPGDSLDDTFPTSPHDFPVSLNCVLDNFISFSSQWHKLYLHLPLPAMRRLIGNEDVALPTLAILDFDILGSTGAKEGEKLIQIPKSAINLHSITFSCDELDIHTLLLPWSQLTELSITNLIDVEECIQFCRLCPNLTILDLSAIGGSLDGRILPEAILPNLISLTLGARAGIDGLLDHLTFPSLQEALIFSFNTSAGRKAELISLFRRSSCPIRALCLLADGFLEEDLIDLVQSVPTLQELDVSKNGNSFVTERIATMLAQRTADTAHSGRRSPDGQRGRGNL